MKYLPIMIIAMLLMACGNKSRHDVPPSSCEDSRREEPKKLEPYKIKGTKEETPKKEEPENNYTPSSKSGSYSSSRDDDDYDNMRGFDPASEDDMDDNGMSRYMENNDDEGWD